MLGGITACADDSTSDDSSAAGTTTALPSNAATGDPIKIGFIAPEGGVVTLPMVREGGEAAAQYLNNNGGGIGGHKIDLVVCKQQEEPASATRCANQMVEQKVAAVVTPLGAQGAVMLPIIAGAGIPYIAQAPVSQVEMASPGSFMLTGGIVAVLGGEAATAAREGVKKLTVFIGDSGDAAASVKALGTPMFQRAGVELDVVTIPTSAADPTPQITAALAGNPGAVTILGDTRQCITTLKALQTAAPSVKKYLIASCLDKPVLDAVGKPAVAGSKAFTTVNTTSEDPSVVLYRSVMAKYAPNTDPSGLGYLGYQVVAALGEVGKSLTGPVTPQSFATALSTATDVPLPAAPGLTFTCNGKAIPQLRALCSKAILVSDVDDDVKLINTTVVNN
ncbi:ABC-type branched-chain amino acid transport systems periplasmic component-like protein [Gordonia bronchialis DSM 43247]|jgi:branched-chain amino acid transport system substrate-binding protein|uniref:ABC-type branched-chain amino acid transport systems periplasmic component-like protein n=1 Tax=Gordonia bronchialis (strain ATCC 25592 / DSM 43247 / BCRC 13721 / JCM 3198 / KCTC 3076 / NBRC 16047 / NCTC 10667) TaxID=526226 RepID=D0L3A7_GORB4|nr:ABC transporter substrate-binding protein [Gordonia bronchialis]ACY23037.1 ABC-type branched-chain amino acid transport systems periplasmic component-like protein [Gordonia bronchialis DSM 43247]MCC3325816.1 ABC transporter substrate-binding protein [Gordonia bronchialis]QGS26856.1 ABC transporter substrate-binding protein [Gordonia bronchialis]UAK40564.1 ABC transporter substrate-binding protein [Gordonia bronchialis]STQ65992.1 leucine ABC transporter subunit substrate-binding protein LivK